ncbi:PAAR domain-containing protein [Serratia sp. L9]|uniref:PAAR domain-containing protein n=1 Tax=Serratia sp. L9 TaxID=3423946 RepID=UPI003D66C16B
MQQDIIQRIARVGAMNAGARPAPVTSQAGPPAARLGDQIKHKSFLGALLGAVTGALIGAAIFAAASLLIVGTGGLATVAVVALGTAGTVAMGGVISRASGAVADFVDSVGSMDGPISTASPNVYIEGKQAARAIVDVVACTKHSSPQKIAQGSESVFINDQPAARVGDKVTCGGTIKEGARSVYVGSGQGSYLEIEEEFSWWEKAILVAVEFLVPPSRGMLKGIGKLFTKAGRAAVVGGAKMGAKQVAKMASGKTFRCATQAFKGGKGLKRFSEAGKKFVKGDPIDVTNGSLVEQRTDIELGQTLPLLFTRTWAPDCGQTFALGQGWTDSFHQYAEVNAADDVIDITTLEGSALHFALPGDTVSVLTPTILISPCIATRKVGSLSTGVALSASGLPWLLCNRGKHDTCLLVKTTITATLSRCIMMRTVACYGLLTVMVSSYNCAGIPVVIWRRLSVWMVACRIAWFVTGKMTKAF